MRLLYQHAPRLCGVAVFESLVVLNGNDHQQLVHIASNPRYLSGERLQLIRDGIHLLAQYSYLSGKQFDGLRKSPVAFRQTLQPLIDVPDSSRISARAWNYRRRSATIVICMSRASRTTCCTSVSSKRLYQGRGAERPM